MQLFLTLDILTVADETRQQLIEVMERLEYLQYAKTQDQDKEYQHFTYRYNIQRANYQRAIGDAERAAHYETLAEEYKEPDVSLLALDEDLQKTLAASSSTSEENDIGFHKKHGDDTWRQFIDQSAQQEPWGLLTRLGREDLDKLSPDQAGLLKFVSIAHAKYVDSCLEAAKKQDLHSEINLSAIMALRLLIVGCFLEAKMYALSVCSKLINSPSSDIKVLDLKKAQALLVRVQEAQLACGDRQTITNSTANTLNILRRLNYPSQPFPTFTVQEGYSETDKMHIKCAIAQDLQEIVRELLLGNTRNLARSPACDGGPSTASSATNTLNIVRTSNKAYSDIDKIEIKCAIAQDLQAIARELLLSNACNLPTIQVPEAKIFRTEQLAKRYKQAGVGIGIAGGLLLCVLVDLGGYVLFKFIQTRKKSSTSLVRAASPSKTSPPSPKDTWRSRLSTTITGIFGVLKLAYGRLLWNKEERMSQESIASRGLNDRLAQAQACHGQGNMQEVLDAFPVPYVMNTKRYKQAGIGTGIVGGILLFWRSTFAATITGIFGVLTVAYGRLLWNKGERMSQESIALRGLNAMLAQAQAYHDQGNMQGVLDVLSSSYATNKKLLLLEEIGESSGEKKIIDLLASGIGPDDVARLFLLIARALVSGQVSIPGCRSNDLNARAENSVQGALSKELEEAAKNLDASVQKRLETMRRIAQTYRTITDISIFKLNFSENNKLADQLCQKTREGIEDYLQLQLYPMPELSSAVIKDSLRVISDHVAAIETLAVGQQSNS